jgi:hypothetical protein
MPGGFFIICRQLSAPLAFLAQLQLASIVGSGVCVLEQQVFLFDTYTDVLESVGVNFVMKDFPANKTLSLSLSP